MDINEIVQRLIDEGISLSLNIEVPEVARYSFAVGPEFIHLLLEDPVAARAHLAGVDKYDYLNWLRDRANVYCAATTRKGRRCRMVVNSGHTVDAKRWVELQGAFCEIHDSKV